MYHGEISDDEAKEIYGHPNAEKCYAWCPRVDVEPIDIRGSRENGRQPQNGTNLGRK